MEKQKWYRDTRFSSDGFNKAIDAIRSFGSKDDLWSSFLSVDHDDSRWFYDDMEEFLADYRKYSVGMVTSSILRYFGNKRELWIMCHDTGITEVHVTAPSRGEIEKIFELFEGHLNSSKITPRLINKPVVFIGHGRSMVWRDLKDHLREKHDLKVVFYEIGARAGHATRDILEEMLAKSSFALLVLTGEDETLEGAMRARQNVIHEAGLFQGKLGFSRAILLLEEGVEEFSNVQGVQCIRFRTGNIRETFGEVLATLRREFGN